MANFVIPDTPEFNEVMRMLETSDKAHADLFNGMFGQLLFNEVKLKKDMEGMKLSFQDGCNVIAAAITSMGIETPAGTSPEEMAANILKIFTGTDTSTGTAVAGDILSGKIAFSKDQKLTGTMPNNGAVAPGALNAGGSYTIPAGYHNGSGKVTANSLSSQTAANAAAAQILSGYTAWVNGSKVTGSMANRGAQTKTFTPSTAAQSYTIPAGYHNGSGKVTVNAVPSGVYAPKIVSSSGGANGTITLSGAGYTPNVGIILYSGKRTENGTPIEGVYCYVNIKGSTYIKHAGACTESYSGVRSMSGISNFAFNSSGFTAKANEEWNGFLIAMRI